MSETDGAPIPRIVIVAYRPKPGRDEVLLAELRDHHPMLRSEGLATDRAPILMRAADGVVIEVFEWASTAAIEEAHDHPRVQKMWARFAACADYLPVGEVAEASAVFSEFAPLDVDFERAPEPPPSERAE
jgi:hypothetical protein